MEEQGKIDLIRANKLAVLLGVSNKTLYNWNKKGILKKYGAGGCTFYRLSEVSDALIELKPNNYKTANLSQKN